MWEGAGVDDGASLCGARTTPQLSSRRDCIPLRHSHEAHSLTQAHKTSELGRSPSRDRLTLRLTEAHTTPDLIDLIDLDRDRAADRPSSNDRHAAWRVPRALGVPRIPQPNAPPRRPSPPAPAAPLPTCNMKVPIESSSTSSTVGQIWPSTDHEHKLRDLGGRLCTYESSCKICHCRPEHRLGTSALPAPDSSTMFASAPALLLRHLRLPARATKTKCRPE